MQQLSSSPPPPPPPSSLTSPSLFSTSPSSPSKRNARYVDITQRTKIPEWARSKQLKTELRKQYFLEKYCVGREKADEL